MDSWNTVLTLALVWGAVVVSPGPDFVVTAHQAAAGSRRRALLVAAGITVGTLVWAAGTMAGLAVLFARASWLVHVIRVVGAVYLTYLGVQLIWRTFRRRQPSGQPAEVAEPATGAFSAVRLGLLTDLANPKAAVFWSSLLSLVLPPTPSPGTRVAVVAVAVAVAAVWYGVVAMFFSLGLVSRAYARARRWIDRITGAVMVGLGIRLVA